MDKLTYPGDCREFIPNRVVGPDMWGAWYRPISAHYFNGVTTIFYRAVPPDELPGECREMSAKVVALRDMWKDWKIWHGRATEIAAAFLHGPRWSNLLRASLISQQRKPQAVRSGSRNRRSHRELQKRFRKLHS
jgi:hypothetical protein